MKVVVDSGCSDGYSSSHQSSRPPQRNNPSTIGNEKYEMRDYDDEIIPLNEDCNNCDMQPAITEIALFQSGQQTEVTFAVCMDCFTKSQNPHSDNRSWCNTGHYPLAV